MQQQAPSDPKQQHGVLQFVAAFVALVASTLWNVFWWFTITFAWKPRRSHWGDWGSVCLITLVPTIAVAGLLALIPWRGKWSVAVCLVLPAVALALYYAFALLTRQ